MTPPRIRSALATSNIAFVAGLLWHLGTWVRPECWGEWCEAHALARLADQGILTDDDESLETFASVLCLTRAALN